MSRLFDDLDPGRRTFWGCTHSPHLPKFGAVRATIATVLVLTLLGLAAPHRAFAQRTEADAFVAKAVADLDEKKYESALENLRRALALEPDHVEALYYTGAAYMALGRRQEAIPPLLRVRQKSPTDLTVAFQLGVAYFALQDYDRAEPLLEEVFRTQPTQDGLGYYVGFMRYRSKDYRGALQAFRAGRASDPQLQQLTRFYTGLALAILGLPVQASAELTEALRLAPGSALTGPAERLRDMISAAGAPKRFTAQIRAGFFSDDNVPVIPNRDKKEPLVATLRQPKHESFGELLGIGGGYTWLRAEAWDATIGYSFFGTYNNEIPSFNVTDHMFTTGLVHRTAIREMPVQFSAQHAFDLLFLGEREFIRRHTATVAATLVESDRHLTQLFTRYQNKDFNERLPLPPSVERQDADNIMAGFVHLLRFAGDRHFLKGGYQIDWEDAQGRDYRYLGHRFSLGGQYTLPWWAIRLKHDLDVHVRDYTEKNFILPSTAPNRKERRDEEITNFVRVELPLPANFTLSAEYQNTRSHSNLAVFDYTRNVVSLILSWTY